MTQLFKGILACCAAAMFAAACSTPAQDMAMADAKPDPRQGEEVNSVCFSSQVRSWRELDNRNVIIEKGVREEYKLELVGSCQPQDAFISIGLPAGTCLRAGDRVVTDARYNDGSCSIRRMHKWNKDATTASAGAPNAS